MHPEARLIAARMRNRGAKLLAAQGAIQAAMETLSEVRASRDEIAEVLSELVDFRGEMAEDDLGRAASIAANKWRTSCLSRNS